MYRNIPGTNRLQGDSPADPKGFTETKKVLKAGVGVAQGSGYVNERMAAEARLRNDYARTIPTNHIDGAR